MATMGSGRSPSSGASSRILKIIGVVLLLIPAAVVALLAVGDMANGDFSAVLELLLGVPLLLLATLGWRRPRLGGGILVGGSIVLGAWWSVWALGSVYGSFYDWTLDIYYIQSMLTLFVPPLVAGLLFLLAARGEHLPAGTA